MRWRERHPAMSWFLTGCLMGLAILLLAMEQGRDGSGGGSQSYYSQF
jgi:hypothetical protein